MIQVCNVLAMRQTMTRDRPEKMEKRLHEAAMEGNVTSLKQLLQEDKLVLDRFLVGCFPETPLHVSAMSGHLDFTKAILKAKPGLARELDFQKSSPLHMATAKGYVEIVKLLLSADPEMCFARDWEGRNPLHVAVIKGNAEVLIELFRVRPQAARDLLDQGGTILHLCVKHNQLECLELLVEMINDHEFANWKDHDGFTILHMAVASKQIKISNFILTSTALKINSLNANGFTALDMLNQGQRNIKDIEIGESLRRYGALRSNADGSIRSRNSPLSSGVNKHFKILRSKRPSWKKKNARSKYENWLEKKMNAVMVIASLIATMAFQAGTNPPDIDLVNHYDATMKYVGWFSFFNSVGFIASLSVILLLISGLTLKNRVFVWILMVIMWITILSMAFAYSISIYLWTPINVDFLPNKALTLSIFAWMAVIVFGHFIRLVWKFVRHVKITQEKSRIYPDSVI